MSVFLQASGPVPVPDFLSHGDEVLLLVTVVVFFVASALATYALSKPKDEEPDHD